MSRKTHFYTDEQKAFLRDNIKGCSYRGITKMFNDKFGVNVSYEAIKGILGRLALVNGIDGCFKKGHVPSNKNQKGVRASPDTEFKKGHKPINWRPIGSERINIYGYIEVKVAEPNKWRVKQQIVWEQHNGPIPKGYKIVFADQNKLNVTISNLLLVSHRQLLTMNRRNLIKPGFAEGTQAGAIIASIDNKIRDLKRKK